MDHDIKNKIIVLCRTKEDIRVASEKLQKQVPFAEFICFSVASYLEAKELGLNATAIKKYCDFGPHTYAYESVDLTRSWLNAVLRDSSRSKEDIINSLIYPMHIFFRTILFAKNTISEIARKAKPTSVIVCARWPLPNIRRQNQETIFAYVCQDYLNTNNIDNTILFTTEVSEGLGVKKRILFFLKRLKLLKPIFSNTVFLYNLYNIIQLHKFIIAYLILVKLSISKYLNRKPQIIMIGAGTDAVFQGKLEDFWNKIRDWSIVRFEGSRKSNFRRKVKDSNNIKTGVDIGLLKILGLSPNIINKNLSRSKMIKEHYTWSNNKKDLRTLLTNRKLNFQFEAMIDFIRQEINSINLFSSAYKKIRPNLVLTHNMNNPIIAAKQSGIKSCSQLEGIGFDVYPMDPQIGDIVAVPGNANVKMIIQNNFWSNPIHNVGAFFIQPNQYPSNNGKSIMNQVDIETPSLSKVIFLVPCLSIFLQYLNEDIVGLIDTMKLLILEARLGAFELVLKFHPRYGDSVIYQDLIGSNYDNSNIQVSNDPNYQNLVEEADLVICTENSGAVIETMFARKPLLWLSYLNPPKDDNKISYDFYSKYIQQVDSDSVLVDQINKLTTDKKLRNNILKKQESGLRQVLSSTGIEAAEKLALACETLLAPNKN